MLVELSTAAVAVGEHFAAVDFNSWEEIKNREEPFTDEAMPELTKGYLLEMRETEDPE